MPIIKRKNIFFFCVFPDLQKYSYVIFYDHDGTAAANIYSHVWATVSKLNSAMVSNFKTNNDRHKVI